MKEKDVMKCWLPKEDSEPFFGLDRTAKRLRKHMKTPFWKRLKRSIYVFWRGLRWDDFN